MINSLKNVPGECIDVRFDLKTSSSVWTALHESYGGTNITKTIARLLNLYQPENGVGAYEELLRTLSVLLEDFDYNNLRSLVSMIPPPKGSPEKTIEETFFNATGFTRIDRPTFYQNLPYFLCEKKLIKRENKQKEEDNSLKHLEINKNGFMNSKTVSNLELENQTIESPQKYFNDCDVLQGLPTTETSHSHIKNTQHLPYFNYNQHRSYQYFAKHETGSLYLPFMDCKKHRSPNQPHSLIKNCITEQTSFPYHSMLIKTANNKYLQLPITTYNISNVHYLNNPSQDQKTFLKQENYANVYDSLDDIFQTKVFGASNYTNYKKELSNKSKLLNKLIHSDLKMCDKFFENKKLENRDDKKINNQFPILYEDSLLETLIVNKNLKSCIENFLKRLKQDLSLNKKNSSIKDSSILTYMQNLSLLNCKKTIDSPLIQYKNNNSNDLRNTNNVMHQKNLMSKLTTYKRQYYDALLDVQRAKMAIANSLILSPAQNFDDYNPYYIDHSQQHHWPIYESHETTDQESLDYQKFVHPQYSNFYNSKIQLTNWNSS